MPTPAPQPHYLRFARTLALATTLALPACAGVDDPAATDGQGDPTTTTPTPSATAMDPGAAPARTITAANTPTDTTTMVGARIEPEDMDAGKSDASPGFSSGPLPPLDMPASMA